jgi:hypothetical protein
VRAIVAAVLASASSSSATVVLTAPNATSAQHIHAVQATAASGRPIQVTATPSQGGLCHLDRTYRFLDLGGFGSQLLYLLTSNDDCKTPASMVMWALKSSVACTVHLSFRSAAHVESCRKWLDLGWCANPTMLSPVTSGLPNGPYSGPTFSQSFGAGTIELRGSDNWEGVYFVFVELASPAADGIDDSSHAEVEDRGLNSHQGLQRLTRSSGDEDADASEKGSSRTASPLATAAALEIAEAAEPATAIEILSMRASTSTVDAAATLKAWQRAIASDEEGYAGEAYVVAAGMPGTRCRVRGPASRSSGPASWARLAIFAVRAPWQAGSGECPASHSTEAALHALDMRAEASGCVDSWARTFSELARAGMLGVHADRTIGRSDCRQPWPVVSRTAGPAAELPAVSPVSGAITWVDCIHRAEALLAELDLRAACKEEFRIGVDCEWATEAGAPALIQLSLSPDEQTYLVDVTTLLQLTAASLVLDRLARWVLDPRERTEVLGFAFEHDTRRLAELIVGEPVAGTRVVDLQQVAMRAGVVSHNNGTPSLQRTVAEVLGAWLDKTEQCSDWNRRPLTPAQLAYAALDSAVLLRLRARLPDSHQVQ